MGKSGKKIKSDRINTLRKQYDAFLEDDKKRKDRNEFILGRLEEMRSSSALVQIRHKDNGHINENIYTSRHLQNSRLEDTLRTSRSSANIPINYSSQRFDPMILREISKNFILIPKLQSNLSNSVTSHYLNPLAEKPDMINNEDTDWKSKYDILNELKKREKEGNSENVNAIFKDPDNKPFVSSSEPLLEQQSQIYEDKSLADNLQKYNTSIDDSPTGKRNSNNFESDTKNSNHDLHALGMSDNIDDKADAKICRKPTVISTESNENNQYTTYVDNTREVEASRLQFPEHKPEIITNMEHYNNVATHDTIQDINKEYANKVDNEIEYKEKSDQEKIDNEIIEHNESNDVSKQGFQEKNISHTENTDYLNVTDNADIVNKEEIQEDPKVNMEIETNVNSLQNYETNETPVLSEHNANAEVSELETEQNEMFYTENPENKYYDEHNMENLQYSEENQNYTNEQYSYHDETQQEQPYAEINEHEESTERYDPNYEQQYTGNYENVPDVSQYENQQYEVENSYETQEANVNYDNVHPNNENIEHMPSENIYHNQEDNIYNYGNENYESQQYATNEQQEYSANDPNIQDQYVMEQEYVGMPTEQETPEHMEKVLDFEEGYVNNESTIIESNQGNPVVQDVPLDKTEASEVS